MSRFSVFEDEEWKQKRKELEAQVAKEKGEILVRTKDGEEYMSPELYNKLVSLGQPVALVNPEDLEKVGIENIRKEQNGFTDRVYDAVAHGFGKGDRPVTLAAQGFNNSYLNPVGLAQRIYNYSQGNGFETSFDYIQPETLEEKMAEYIGNSLPAMLLMSVPMPRAGALTGYFIDRFFKDGFKLYSDYEKHKEEARKIIRENGPGSANGYDNYSHRKAFYEVSQNGPVDFIIGQGLGLLKEGYDYYNKRQAGMSHEVALNDGVKDLTNNWESGKKGLQNPLLDSKIWLKDFDWKSNTWKK